MNVPARFPYDPRWQVLAYLWMIAAGLPILGLAGFFPMTCGVALSVGFAGFGVLLIVRRYSFPRTLVLDEEGMWLPSGFLRMHVRRVDFAEVSDLWEAPLPGMVILCLRCQSKTLEVASIFLPDHETYQAVGRYIYSRVMELHAEAARPAPPGPLSENPAGP